VSIQGDMMTKRERAVSRKNKKKYNMDLAAVRIKLSDATILKSRDKDYDEYMHGMANGLILALSIINGEPPKYVEVKKFKRYKGISRLVHRLLKWLVK